MNTNSIKNAMKASRNTAAYESRSSINRKNKVNQVVNKLASGLASYGDDSTDDLMNTASIDKLIDEYYRPGEFPSADGSADAATEMGAWEHPRCKAAIIGGALLLAGLFFYCRR